MRPDAALGARRDDWLVIASANAYGFFHRKERRSTARHVNLCTVTFYFSRLVNVAADGGEACENYRRRKCIVAAFASESPLPGDFRRGATACGRKVRVRGSGGRATSEAHDLRKPPKGRTYPASRGGQKSHSNLIGVTL